MKELKAAFTAIVAICVLGACAASQASAVTVSPGGAITASFPAGGLTWRDPLSTTSCAMEFAGNLDGSGGGAITAARVTPNPCAGITYVWLMPWPVTISSPSGGLAGFSFPMGYERNIFGIRCLYAGVIRWQMASPGPTFNAILPPVSTVTGMCGTQIMGGTGGRLTPIQTVTP